MMHSQELPVLMIKLPAAPSTDHPVNLEGAFPVVAGSRLHPGHSFTFPLAPKVRLTSSAALNPPGGRGPRPG
jgi:hypothetical protein